MFIAGKYNYNCNSGDRLLAAIVHGSTTCLFAASCAIDRRGNYVLGQMNNNILNNIKYNKPVDNSDAHNGADYISTISTKQYRYSFYNETDKILCSRSHIITSISRP